MSTLIIHTDGGSRGNPGPAACAAVFLNSGREVVYSTSRYLGHTTNNEAEYRGVILALETILADLNKYSEFSSLQFVLDSELVVFQLTGRYKIKNANLQQLATTTHQLIRQINKPTSFTHVKRHLNTLPDELLNQELDRN